MITTIVGSGPSLLRLTPDDFPDGPVIAINTAIVGVRPLGLSVVYVMHKDGCVPHNSSTPVPLGCICPTDKMVPPVMPERLIVSAAESPLCFPDYPDRIVVDVERLTGLPWWTMSAPVAVHLAAMMGASEVRMLAMDGWTGSDSRRVSTTGRIERLPLHPYLVAGRQSIEEAKKLGLGLTFGP